MTAIPVFHRSATPTRDMMPISGVDHEFMAFLAIRKKRVERAAQQEGSARHDR